MDTFKIRLLSTRQGTRMFRCLVFCLILSRCCRETAGARVPPNCMHFVHCWPSFPPREKRRQHFGNTFRQCHPRQRVCSTREKPRSVDLGTILACPLAAGKPLQADFMHVAWATRQMFWAHGSEVYRPYVCRCIYI